MTCEEFRASHARFSDLPLAREVWDTPEFGAWADHLHACLACQTWDRNGRLTARGVDVSAYPCPHMAEQATHRCDAHPVPQDCPDVLVRHLAESNRYGIPIRDGGSAVAVIGYCPWCGIRLPAAPPGSAAPTGRVVTPSG